MDTTLLSTAGFMCLTYVVIALVITPANTRYLLAGYNTMSEEKRQAFDIELYLTEFFKKLAFFENTEAMVSWSIIQSLPFKSFLWRSYAFRR